jgi:hypothetical protein
MRKLKNFIEGSRRENTQNASRSSSSAETSPVDKTKQQAVRVENVANQHKQAEAWSSTVYRIKNVRGLSESQLRCCLAQELDLGENDVKIHSFVLDATWKREDPTWTATVSFKTKPNQQEIDTNNGGKLLLDNDFLGFTPLTSGNQIDCVAIHGWGGHAFGSFRAKGSLYMWLRDSLPKHFPQLRVWIYGYDFKLNDENNNVNLLEHAESFVQNLRNLRAKTETDQRTPLIFIAHSLGGLILQDAIIQMKKSSNRNDQLTLNAIYGALFFGVPGRGMDVEALATMVQNLPSRYTMNLLDKNLGRLLQARQLNEFHNAFNFKDSKIIQFYEKNESPTVQQVGSSWSRTGPKVLLVNSDSACCGRSWESTSEYKIGLNSNHSDMVKFEEYDSNDYDHVLRVFDEFVKDADIVIKKRFQSGNLSIQTYSTD